MAQKLWEKSVQVNKDIERFTVGRDREMDLYLAKHDVVGSMAHITMLESIGLLTKEELALLLEELKNIYAAAEKGEFVIEEGVEDVHSQVELMLTRKLGDIGKKIHSGRSRNDQVLLDLKLFTRAQIKEIAGAVEQLFHAKMLRVMMLAPFLLFLAARVKQLTPAGNGEKSKITIPWFAIMFILVAVFNSFHLLPKAVVDMLVTLDTVLLAMAMAALGVTTHVSALKKAGAKPLLMALMLFVWLIVGGGVINVAIHSLMA